MTEKERGREGEREREREREKERERKRGSERVKYVRGRAREKDRVDYYEAGGVSQDRQIDARGCPSFTARDTSSHKYVAIVNPYRGRRH